MDQPFATQSAIEYFQLDSELLSVGDILNIMSFDTLETVCNTIPELLKDKITLLDDAEIQPCRFTPPDLKVDVHLRCAEQIFP